MGSSEKLTKIKEFKATPIRCLYNSENFKIYGCTIDSFKYLDIAVSKYGTVTIKGDIQELNLDCEYIIKAEEEKDKYGIGYKVINIRSEKPVTLENSRTFLQEILTYQQASTLLAVYPDIIDRIINNRLNDIDLNKTKGIKEVTFAKIKKKVIENFKLAELVDEFSGVFSFSIIKKLYDTYPSIEKIKENLHTKPYECLCKLGGIGFKTADALLLRIDELSKESVKNGEKPIIDFKFDLLTSAERMKACCSYVLDENENNGNTYMSIKQFQKECLTYAPEAKDKLADAINSSDTIIFDKKQGRISKTNTFETEKYIADTLKNALKVNHKWNVNIEKYRVINNSSLTNEQMQTMKFVCENTITVLQGFAGSGKSFSVLALMNMLYDNNLTAILLAPTGRAAKVLQKYTNHMTSTIHRGLGFMPPNEWCYNEKNKLPQDIVILDETSMVDVFLFKHLLESIDFNRTKLLIIGDNAQIPSVSCGNVLHDILNSNIVPTVWLSKVFRYGKGGLSTVATDIRESKLTFQNATGTQTIGEDKGCTYIPIAPERAVDYIIKMYKKLLENNIPLKDILIVVAQNKGNYGTEKINNQIQSVINTNVTKKTSFGDVEYRIGDPIIQCKNDYQSFIYQENHADYYNTEEDVTTLIPNGDIGIISDITYNGIIVDFDDYKIYIPKDKFPNIKLAYAISIHKSQGGQARIVIVFAPNSHTFMLNSNLLYVAITRAKERCYLLSDLNTFGRAIKKKENFTRRTWLYNLLIEGE